MTALRTSYSVVVPRTPIPMAALRFVLRSEGKLASGKRVLRLYRSWNSVAQCCMVFEDEGGGTGLSTQVFTVPLADLAAQAEWVAVGVDDNPPRKTRAAYLAIQEGGTYTFNIASPVDKPEGFGYLAGEFPDGITTRLDTPISATIKVLHTAEDGRMGKVAEVVSNPDGTWIVDNLDPTKQFDVICSLAGFNDLILSKVSPTPY